MSLQNHIVFTSALSANTRFFSPVAIGIVWGALLLAVGVIYRTYNISLSSQTWEFSRQIGLPFLIVEMVFIVFAGRKGFQIAPIWKNFPASTKISIIVFFTSMWVGAIFFSALPHLAIALNIGIAVHFLFGTALYYCLNEITTDDISGFAVVIVGSMFIFCIFTAWHFLSRPLFLNSIGQAESLQFAIPGFISVRLFGAVCGAILALLIALVFADKQDGKGRSWLYPAIVLVSGAMIWSGTRAALLGVVCALLTMFILYPVKIRVYASLKIMIGVCIGGAVAYLLIPNNDPAFLMFVTGDFQNTESATGGRLSLWKEATFAIMNNPFFGLGPGASRWAFAENIFPHAQPHNMILQFLLSWGLIGAIPAFWILGQLIWSAHKIALKKTIAIPIVTMMYSLIIMSMFDGILHFSRHFMMVVICFAIIFASGKKHRPA